VGYRLEVVGPTAQEARPRATVARAANRVNRMNVVRPEFLERLGVRRRVFIGSLYLTQNWTSPAMPQER
jgi:hypothetical protein